MTTIRDTSSCPSQFLPPEDTGKVGAGQIRRLNPHPDVEAGESRLVLLITDPSHSYMPEDISWNPGPCRIVHGLLLDSPLEWATTRDIVIDPERSGCGFPLHAWVDSLTTIRLDPDETSDHNRFGPQLGTTFPEDLCDFLWDAYELNDTDITTSVERWGLRTGLQEPQTGDHLWYHRCREIRNLNHLNGWW